MMFLWLWNAGSMIEIVSYAGFGSRFESRPSSLVLVRIRGHLRMTMRNQGEKDGICSVLLLGPGYRVL